MRRPPTRPVSRPSEVPALHCHLASPWLLVVILCCDSRPPRWNHLLSRRHQGVNGRPALPTWDPPYLPQGASRIPQYYIATGCPRLLRSGRGGPCRNVPKVTRHTPALPSAVGTLGGEQVALRAALPFAASPSVCCAFFRPIRAPTSQNKAAMTTRERGRAVCRIKPIISFMNVGAASARIHRAVSELG